MEHLEEIEDAAARAGVNTFQTQMEVVVLSLLNPNRPAALAQIAEARAASLVYLENLGSAFLSPVERVKAGRVAKRMLLHTFGRLRIVMEASDDDETTGEPN